MATICWRAAATSAGGICLAAVWKLARRWTKGWCARLGVYSKPGKQEVVLAFLCRLRDPQAQPTTSEEVSEVAWFSPDALPADLLPKHRQRIEDALLGRCEAVVRAQRSSTEEDQGLPEKG